VKTRKISDGKNGQTPQVIAQQSSQELKAKLIEAIAD
jgi:hypothetical protein